MADDASAVPFELPPREEIRLASGVTVKRKKMSYGDKGVLMLTLDRLVFLTDNPDKCWSLPLSEIGDVSRPWYGFGTYVTFTARGQYFALAFAEGEVDDARLSSIGDALGTTTAATGFQALAVAGTFRAASTGGEFYGIISGEDERQRNQQAAKVEAEWQAQQQQAPPRG